MWHRVPISCSILLPTYVEPTQAWQLRSGLEIISRHVLSSSSSLVLMAGTCIEKLCFFDFLLVVGSTDQLIGFTIVASCCTSLLQPCRIVRKTGQTRSLYKGMLLFGTQPHSEQHSGEWPPPARRAAAAVASAPLLCVSLGSVKHNLYLQRAFSFY